MDDRAKQINDLVALNGCEGRSKAGKVGLIQKNDRFFPGTGKFLNLASDNAVIVGIDEADEFDVFFFDFC